MLPMLSLSCRMDELHSAVLLLLQLLLLLIHQCKLPVFSASSRMQDGCSKHLTWEPNVYHE